MLSVGRPKLFHNKYFRLLVIFVSVYFFLVSISLVSASFTLFGSDFADQLIQTTSNPFVALFIGILITSLIQSSSATTSIVVGMVAAGVMPLGVAIPVIMGANVGTSVTNLLVSLGYVSRKHEFRLAFAGAIQHDLFNLLAILILFPLELFTHLLENSSLLVSNLFSDLGGITFISPIKFVINPTSQFIVSILNSNPLLIIIVAVVILFVCLMEISTNLKEVLATKAEEWLDNYLFKRDSTAFCFGAALTATVQSSSITTSLVIPLIAARMLSLKKAFPYMLGSNIGTTITAFLAALALASPVAIAVSLAHFFFNLLGVAIIYPARRLPIYLAEKLGFLVAESKYYAFLYILGVFYLIPLFVIILIGGG